MSLTERLPAPGPQQCLQGKDVLFRFHPALGDSAIPVAPLYLQGVERVKTDPYAAAEVRQVFGVDDEEPHPLGFDYAYRGAIRMLSSCAGELLDAALGLELAASGPFLFPMTMNNRLAGALEAVYRTETLQHKFSFVFPEIVLESPGTLVVDGCNFMDIPFTSTRMPFRIPAGVELRTDRFTGDGTSTVFQLSTQPVELLNPDIDIPESWPHPAIAALVITTPGGTWGRYVTDGIELNGQALAFDTAPLVNADIRVVYGKFIAEQGEI